MTTRGPEWAFTNKSLRQLEEQWGEEALGNALVNAADEIGGHTEGEVAEVTPTNKNPQPGQTRGRLAAGWTHKVVRAGSGATVIVGNAVQYGPFVNFGTGTFAGKGRIFPKTAKVLVFQGRGGGLMFVGSIAGQPGQHFAEKGLDNAVKDIPAIAAAQIERDLGD